MHLFSEIWLGSRPPPSFCRRCRRRRPPPPPPPPRRITSWLLVFCDGGGNAKDFFPNVVRHFCLEANDSHRCPPS